MHRTHFQDHYKIVNAKKETLTIRAIEKLKFVSGKCFRKMVFLFFSFRIESFLALVQCKQGLF